MDDYKVFVAYLRQMETLTEEQLLEALLFAEMLLKERERVKNYDPTKDPILQGETLISGSEDLAERMEDILYPERAPLFKVEKQTS